MGAAALAFDAARRGGIGFFPAPHPAVDGRSGVSPYPPLRFFLESGFSGRSRTVAARKSRKNGRSADSVIRLQAVVLFFDGPCDLTPFVARITVATIPRIPDDRERLLMRPVERVWNRRPITLTSFAKHPTRHSIVTFRYSGRR